MANPSDHPADDFDEFQGGSRPVKHMGQDTPKGSGRSAGGIVAGILAALALAVPLLWFGGRLVGLDRFVGVGNAAWLWILFALLAAGLGWYGLKLLRRST